MARIPYVDPEEAAPEARQMLDKLPPLNVFRALAHSPAALKGFVRMGNALLYKGTLEPALRELAILRVGHLSGAAYEIHQHEDIAAQLGVSPDKVAATAEGPDAAAFSESERAALRLVDDIVANVGASDAAFTGAEAHFGHPELVELTLTAGYYMMVARFLETMKIDLEPSGTQGLDFGAKGS